jgi:hypothetical protein
MAWFEEIISAFSIQKFTLNKCCMLPPNLRFCSLSHGNAHQGLRCRLEGSRQHCRDMYASVARHYR